MFKISKSVPLYKKGDRQECKNYRILAISSWISKVFETIVYNKIMSFINKFNILTDSQFGFRSNHSTTLALIEVVNLIKNNLNDSHVMGIFLDFERAFDSISHKI